MIIIYQSANKVTLDENFPRNNENISLEILIPKEIF